MDWLGIFIVGFTAVCVAVEIALIVGIVLEAREGRF